MEIEAQAMPSKPGREPWNKGKSHWPETTAAAKGCLADTHPLTVREVSTLAGESTMRR
jgi:hypothetical protein